MYHTELDYLQLILLENGELNTALKTVLDKIDMVGYRYSSKNKKYYYADAENQESFEGIGDTQGNYAYVRYTSPNADHKFAAECISVRLTFVACFPNCGNDTIKIGLKLMHFMKEARVSKCKATNFSPLRSNRKELWETETGHEQEKYRSDLSIIAFDFDLVYSSPNDCDLTNYQCSA